MLAAWVANVVKPHVKEVMVADPRENAWISRNPHKNDMEDALRLCRLLRMGELKRVYHPEDDLRALFKAAAQHYIDMRNQQVALKQKIKAMYRHWGVLDVNGRKVYAQKGRQEYLKKVPHVVVRHQLHRLYALMDEAECSEAMAARELRQLGRSYPEVREWKKIPGIGPIIALLFNALIQTPHRFADKRKLWRYCRLGITDRSSDGKPLGYKRLDHSGIGDLKSLSYWAWMAAMKGNNEVRRFYESSLARTHNHVHARLNTQRKILAVMYGLWKKGGTYRPECFLGLSVV
jgi:transposase